MDLSMLHQQLIPCDMEAPFVFVSYSSSNKEIVWADVIELQKRGYNIWIDEANLDKSKSSWKDDALKAIEDYNCALLLFYVSKNSLTSESCLNELDKTISESTQENHLGKVEFVAIDAEDVGNMGDFISSIGIQIEQSDATSQEKSRRTRILFRFKSKWFHEDNEKVRIHPKTERDRVGDYYSDIEKELNRNRREIRLSPDKLTLRISPERLYRYAVDCIMNGKFDYAITLLEAGACTYAPSALLLAHLYYVGCLNMPIDTDRANQLWGDVDVYISADKWKQVGIDYNNLKFYSEAIAYFMAHGEKMEDTESLFMASQMWIKKGCQSQAIISLRLAAKKGSDKAQAFLNRLYSYDEEEVYKHAYRDEMPVK